MKRWLVFDVGCIECGEPSGVVGMHDTYEEAEAAAQTARDDQGSRWTGQHSFEVIDLVAGTPRSRYAPDVES